MTLALQGSFASGRVPFQACSHRSNLCVQLRRRIQLLVNSPFIQVSQQTWTEMEGAGHVLYSSMNQVHFLDTLFPFECWGPTWHDQGSLLCLHSGITPVIAGKGSLAVPEMGPELAVCKVSTFPCTISRPFVLLLSKVSPCAPSTGPC